MSAAIAQEPLDNPMLQRLLRRAEARVASLERMIEDRSRELFLAKEDTRQLLAEVESIVLAMPVSLLVVGADGLIWRANPAAEVLLDISSDSLLGRPIAELVPEILDCGVLARLTGTSKELDWRRGDGILHPVLTSVADLGHDQLTLCVGWDMTERKLLENQLVHAQKMESIGVLSAGIAHEINTPIQFISDNLTFLDEVARGYATLFHQYQLLEKAAVSDQRLQQDLGTIAELKSRLDMEFLEEEAPKAIAQAKDGIKRVASIVSAVKSFSHPGQDSAQEIDLNRLLEDTAVLSRNEWKHVAQLTTVLDPDLPPLRCHRGPIQQVVLNMIVNSAHAIHDVVAGSGNLGKIVLRTRREGSNLLLEIEDTGGGIPESIRAKIYDPFFTTKEVGRGTGQGLAIAYDVVVKKHGGTIDCTSEVGIGTLFSVRLPLIPTAPAPEAP